MTEIDDFLNKLDAPRKSALERVRRIVRETVPEATELISYGMPAFKYNGKYLVGYCAFKNHLSLFPTSGPIVAFKDELQEFKLSSGTIQFTVEKAIPEATIRAILKCRLAAVSGE